MGQYRLWINFIKGFSFAIFLRDNALWIYVLCFEIMIGIEKEAKGVYFWFSDNRDKNSNEV